MNILITGITGLLGTALVEVRPKDIRISGLYLGNYQMQNSEFVRYAACDVSDKDMLLSSYANLQIDCIIHAAGIADTDYCEKEFQRSYISNVVGTKNIIELASLKKAKLVYISTNAVFDGESAPYSEKDVTSPINNYGKLKLECEEQVRGSLKEHLIIRPILMYGLNNPYERKCFALRVIEKLRKREPINVVDDVFENQLLSYHGAELIWQLIEKGKTGIYHISGKEALNRYESVKVIAKEFLLDHSLITPVPSNFFPLIAARPKNTSYCTEKIENELGVEMLKFEQGLILFKQRMKA